MGGLLVPRCACTSRSSRAGEVSLAGKKRVLIKCRIRPFDTAAFYLSDLRSRAPSLACSKPSRGERSSIHCLVSGSSLMTTTTLPSALRDVRHDIVSEACSRRVFTPVCFGPSYQQTFFLLFRRSAEIRKASFASMRPVKSGRLLQLGGALSCSSWRPALVRRSEGRRTGALRLGCNRFRHSPSSFAPRLMICSRVNAFVPPGTHFCAFDKAVTA